MSNDANLKCSIIEVVGRVDNKVGDMVRNYDMVVGLLVSKKASYKFFQCSHFYVWLVTQVTMGNCLLDAPPYRYDIRRCYLMGIPIGDA